MGTKSIDHNLEPSALADNENIHDLIGNLESPIEDVPEEEDSNYLERRSTLRFGRDDIKIWIKVSSLLSSGKYKPATLVNISSTGARIQLVEKIRVGRRVDMKLVFDDQDEFIVSARVAWREEEGVYGYGIQFNEKNPLLGNKIVETYF